PSNALARRGQVLLLARQAGRANEKGDLDQAIEICLKQLAIDPAYTPAMAHLGSLHFELEQGPEEVEWLNRATATAPDNLHLRMSIGETYLENGYFDEAEVEFGRAVALKPTFEILHDIALLYLDEDEVKTSIKYFDRAAEVADMDELIDLATHMFDADRDKDANRYLARAKKLDPTNPMPYVVKAVGQLRDPLSFLLGVKNPDKLRKDLELAEKLAMTYPEHAQDLDFIRDLKRRLESPSRFLR